MCVCRVSCVSCVSLCVCACVDGMRDIVGGRFARMPEYSRPVEDDDDGRGRAARGVGTIAAGARTAIGEGVACARRRGGARARVLRGVDAASMGGARRAPRARDEGARRMNE